MWKRIVLLFIVGQPLLAFGNSDLLNQYIAEGLEHNLALQQKEFSLEKSLEALKEARGMFLPSVAVQARYSRAGGGRLIEIPVGDLVNPVFTSLNELYRFHGIEAGFPTNLQNEIFPFLREREQETKIRIIQPLFQPALYYNYKIKSSLTRINQAEVSAYKRQLIADIKIAYFNYAKTLKIGEILEKTRLLLEENMRVSEKLVENGKATEDVVFRARAELADLKQKRAEAERNRILAASYFNFLLNRPLETPIALIEEETLSATEPVDLENALKHALECRDEFQQIDQAIKISSHQIGLATTNFLPSVIGVVDYGIQGEEYRFTKEDDFWMASLVFQWTLFDGNQNLSKRTQALLEKKKLEIQKAELERKIQLQVQDEYQTLEAAQLTITAAQEKERSAKESFDIVAKKYKYGTAPQIEYLDAQTTYTRAAINSVIALYSYFIQRAKFEQVSAFVNLARYEK